MDLRMDMELQSYHFGQEAGTLADCEHANDEMIAGSSKKAISNIRLTRILHPELHEESHHHRSYLWHWRGAV